MSVEVSLGKKAGMFKGMGRKDDRTHGAKVEGRLLGIEGGREGATKIR